MAFLQSKDFYEFKRQVEAQFELLRQQLMSLPTTAVMPENMVEIELIQNTTKAQWASLVKHGYLTVASLKKATDEQLLDLQDIGDSGLVKIRSFAPYEATNDQA